MASEFVSVWEDINAPSYELNAANLCAISPHLIYIGKQYINPVEGQKQRLSIAGGTTFKIINNGVHRLYRVNNDIVFNPASLLDEGSDLENGVDYNIYIVVDNGSTANLVVSKNITFPNGANADNSRRIGGFHTLCADIGTLLNTNSHPLYGFMAKDILPQSCWDLINRPYCNPAGMVKSFKLPVWYDIYFSSGDNNALVSKYNGTIRHSIDFDTTEYLLSLQGKKLLDDTEFTDMSYTSDNFIPNVNFPVTTGGYINSTSGRRVVSFIGCEEATGVMQVYLRNMSSYMTLKGDTNSPTWVNINNLGMQIKPTYLNSAGLGSGNFPNGIFSRSPINTRLIGYTNTGIRGCCNSITVI